MLYPFKFKPQYKEKIWGGNKLKTILNKDFSPLSNCGESWEISGVQGEVSEVANGFLAGNNLQELIEIYMTEIVGETVYNKFGIEFPLLIKYIDAEQDLSIQVHPDDEMAEERHNAYGKTEMWYVINAEPGAKLISGFNQEVDKQKYLNHLETGKLEDILNFEDVKPGDVFFMPAGRVHAIGSGIVLAEIQQTSDITYRIYDYNRPDKEGNLRELHTDLALDAIDYTLHEKYRTDYVSIPNMESRIVHCNYFNTNVLKFDKKIEKDYNMIDSFVIYMCVDGQFTIDYQGEQLEVQKGETVLVPAALKIFDLVPQKEATLLEIYIREEIKED